MLSPDRPDRGRTVALGVALTLISAIGFGSGSLFAKPAYAAGLDWNALMAWRFLIGAGLAWLWLAAIPDHRSAARRLDRRAVLVAGLLGVLYTGNSGTYYAALETVPASLGALIVYVYPAIVAVLALRVGRRLDGRRAWAALAMATLGVALAIGGIDMTEPPPVAGLALMIASPVIYSAWIVLSARLSGERRGATGTEAGTGTSPIAAGAVMLTATAATYWLGNLAAGASVLPADIPPTAWPGIAGVGVISTFVAIQAFYAGAHRIGAARASLISTIEPLWTISLAGLLLGERLTPIQLAGGALVIAGVVLAQTGRAADRPTTMLGERGELRLADE